MVDAAEVAGRLAPSSMVEMRDINVRGLFRTLRADICGCRRKDEVRMALFQLLAIFLQRTRIARQVVRAVKLHGLTKILSHHDICTGFRFVDQFHMAVMQVNPVGTSAIRLPSCRARRICWPEAAAGFQ